MWDRIKSRLPLFLFGLPFAALGIGMFAMGIYGNLLEWHQMKSWQSVEARVLDGGFETSTDADSTTYKAYADYVYRWNGAQYRGTRVAIASGGDNIGSFQQTLGRRLERAVQNGQTLPVWVNPNNPHESVVSRDLRWELLTFELMFVAAFGGLGIAMMLGAVFSSPAEAPASKAEVRKARPWLTRPEWASATIGCHGRLQMWVMWGIAGFWNLLSTQAALFGVEAVRSGNRTGIVALIFPLIGVGLLVWAVRLTLNWRRFGRVTLHLDPYPGAIGGQVGGWFELNLPYHPGLAVRVTLACIERFTSGSADDRNTDEICLWQTSGYAHSQPQAVGTRVELLFDVPEGLPESSEPDHRYHLWRLEVSADLPGIDFARQFEIPVFRTAERAKSIRRLSLNHSVES